eukprot:SAG31_NODE_2667_length_5273_cov_2.316776_8_plen_55_part_00
MLWLPIFVVTYAVSSILSRLLPDGSDGRSEAVSWGVAPSTPTRNHGNRIAHGDI